MFLFIALLLVSLVITLPASIVLSEVKLDERIKIGAANGVWWSFSVDWISYQGVTLDKTQFDLNALCLIQIAVCMDVKNEQANLHLKKSLLNDELIVENSEFDIGFDQLTPWMKTMFVKPTGDLGINVTSLKLTQNTLLDLDAQINWYSVGAQGETFDLGTVKAQLNHQPNSIKMVLSDQSKKMDLSGQVVLSNTGLIDSQIQLKTLTGFPSSIKTVLQSVMQKRGRDIFEYKAKVNNKALKSLNIKL